MELPVMYHGVPVTLGLTFRAHQLPEKFGSVASDGGS